jgi:NTP pyrophosphatase (non-canonical NTP hydrolase)
MPRPILVVGLAGRTTGTDLEHLLAGRNVLARCRAAVAGVWPQVDHAYDAELERESIVGIETMIAADIASRADGANVALLSPGIAFAGDAIVAALAEIAPVEFAIRFSSPLPPHVQIIDALTLAQAQEQEPFDAGISPLEATVPSIICNWHGMRVTDLAAERIRKAYGIDDIPASDENGMLVIPAVHSLDGPPSFAALAQITARLRRPDGCPWDRKQTHTSMLDDFASEVEEFRQAVGAEDWSNAAEELGDVMLNVLMQAQIGVEAGHFGIEDVLAGINAKLVRRHPHVFGDVEANSPEDVLAVWNSVKQQERAGKAAQ